MELIMANPTERELIRMRQVAEYDWNTMIHVAKNEGIEEGKALGITLGIDKGKAEIARDMKREGYAPEVIVRLCKLTQEEISAL